MRAFWVKYRLLGWSEGRLDPTIRRAILLLLVGPGRAAIDTRWTTKGRGAV